MNCVPPFNWLSKAKSTRGVLEINKSAHMLLVALLLDIYVLQSDTSTYLWHRHISQLGDVLMVPVHGGMLKFNTTDGKRHGERALV